MTIMVVVVVVVVIVMMMMMMMQNSRAKENREWKYKVQRSGENVIYPFIVCNIGSGVSILKVRIG